MPANEQASGKFCVMCGVNCEGRPRTKDKHGRYYCPPCYQYALKQAQAKRAKAAAVAAAPVAAPRPQPKPQPVPAQDDLFGDLASHEKGGETLELAKKCPSCEAEMPHAAVVCMLCGFNLKTGVRPQTVTTQPAAPVQYVPTVQSEPNQFVEILLSPITITLVPLTIMLALVGLSRVHEVGVLLYLAFAVLYGFGIGIWVLVNAFMDSVVTGILCLCVPFYAIYYVFFRSGDARLQGAYAVSLVGSLLMYVAVPEPNF